MIDITACMNKLAQKRPVFTSEADFQFSLAWEIKSSYSDSEVILEYIPRYNRNVHIDILVVVEGGFIPIELKYKTRGTDNIAVNGIQYHLKNHGAKDVNCYKYLYDIQRIEEFRDKGDSFVEGYTIFITNETSYKKAPTKKDCVYAAFSLEEGITKTGNMDWSPEASEGTKKGCENPINLAGTYLIHWDDYSCIDTSKEGTFIWTMAKVKATESLLTP